MSFHATHIRLPASAVLAVRGSATTVVYRPGDIRKSELWSRVLPGESLDLTISVADSERDQVVLDIQSFQAGYRSLGAGTQDHPYYRKLQLRSSTAGNGSCVQNYQCSATPANTPIAQATVAVLIGNTYQCTGTLINDVPGDNTPYILTARHCENGLYGGGTPSAAANMTVYWNATTSCSATLGSIYDPAAITQSGATTVVEQQDLWLVRLEDSPAYPDAQFAGFDASGATVQGGYTIHHALGYNDQLTQWFGQAYSSQQTNVLGSSFVSNFLETVNQTGNIGPGASGSGLIDSNNRLVGTLSLGRQSSDPSGYESCPVASPSAPNGSNGAADFIALARVWNSTADTTSSTGTATLKSVLDPTSSGVQQVASVAAVNLHFTASSHSLSDGDSLVLSWNASGASGCTASGGTNSDGWSGALAASGSVTLTETFGSDVKYSLACQFPSGKQINSSTTVFWYGSVPYVFLDSFGIRWVDATATLTWTANVAPCSITGGGLSLSGLPSSGSTSTTQSTVGDVTYKISCGTAPASASSGTTVTYITPAVTFRATGTDRLIGQEANLYWWSYADTCIPSGGAPGDGWTSNALGPQDYFGPRVTAPGTYTYNLTCSAGPNQVTQSVTVTWENDAPYVTLSATPATVTYSATPADYTTLSWKSNLSYCTLTSSGGNLTQQFSTYPLMPSGAGDPEDSGPFAPGAPGDYVLSMSCNTGVGPQASAVSTPVTLHVLPPPPPTVQISVSSPTVSIGELFTVNWTSTNAKNCTQVGTAENGGLIWYTGSGLDPSGSLTASGNYGSPETLGITCESIDPNQAAVSAQTQVNIELAPGVSLSVTPLTVNKGDTYTLTWSSSYADTCTASGGGADGSTWTGDIGTSGSVTKTATTAGQFDYNVTCVQRSLSAKSAATLTVSAASGTSGSSGSGGKSGGGGGLEVLDLLALLAGLLIARPQWTCMRNPSR